jgi:polysaccharide pyruvyl transferase
MRWPPEGAIVNPQPPFSPSPKRILLLGASPSLGTFTWLPTVVSLGAETPGERLRRTGGNSGNQIIAFGLLKALQFESLTWDYSIGPERANTECDVIVIAAANFLHSRFDFGGMASFIEATKLPCVMVGVGAQSNDYSSDIPLMPGTDRLMRVVAERSKLIGARGPFTAEVLARMAIHNVQITGCPSYYMNCTPRLELRKSLLGDKPRLLINSSRDVVSHSFDREHMISVIGGLIKIAIETDADFVAQTEVPEIGIADASNRSEVEANFRKLLEEFPTLRNAATEDKLLCWLSHHARVFWDVATWYEEMKKYDFVFGNRFHGNLIALEAGTPACVICHDSRTTEMCDFLAIPSIALKALERVDVKELYDLVDIRAMQKRYSQLYPEYKKFLQHNGLRTNLA